MVNTPSDKHYRQVADMDKRHQADWNKRTYQHEEAATLAAQHCDEARQLAYAIARAADALAPSAIRRMTDGWIPASYPPDDDRLVAVRDKDGQLGFDCFEKGKWWAGLTEDWEGTDAWCDLPPAPSHVEAQDEVAPGKVEKLAQTLKAAISPGQDVHGRPLSSTATPRTDALVEQFRAEKFFDVDEALDLARQLERELAEVGAAMLTADKRAYDWMMKCAKALADLESAPSAIAPTAEIVALAERYADQRYRQRDLGKPDDGAAYWNAAISLSRALLGKPIGTADGSAAK